MTKHTWLKIQRNSSKTILIIPGWSMLPQYFSTLFPHNNLIILTPFLSKKTRLLDHNMWKSHELSTNNIKFDTVFIFSMGLQWAYKYWPALLERPCHCWSTSISYSKDDVDTLIKNLNSSFKPTLKRFYKSCCSSLSTWRWWSKTMLHDHLNDNTVEPLIHWLNDIALLNVSIEKYPSLQFFVDKNDPFGVKPNASKTITHHSYGHIIQPKEIF